MSNKEFRRHIAQLLARQRNEAQAAEEEKPPKSEPSKLSSRREKETASH
jgi:hypothetical protein